jgi:hypothetical protein
VKTAILQAFLIYGIAFVMSMLVALLIKGLDGLLRRFTDKS